MKSTKQVAIIYNYIAHYRIPIFKILSNNTNPLYTIIAGTKPEIPIKIADISLAEKKEINWIPIKNIWFFKYFLWQKGIRTFFKALQFIATQITQKKNLKFSTTISGKLLFIFKSHSCSHRPK